MQAETVFMICNIKSYPCCINLTKLMDSLTLHSYLEMHPGTGCTQYQIISMLQIKKVLIKLIGASNVSSLLESGSWNEITTRSLFPLVYTFVKLKCLSFLNQ